MSAGRTAAAERFLSSVCLSAPVLAEPEPASRAFAEPLASLRCACAALLLSAFAFLKRFWICARERANRGWEKKAGEGWEKAGARREKRRATLRAHLLPLEVLRLEADVLHLWHSTRCSTARAAHSAPTARGCERRGCGEPWRSRA